MPYPILGSILAPLPTLIFDVINWRSLIYFLLQDMLQFATLKHSLPKQPEWKLGQLTLFHKCKCNLLFK